MDSLSHEARSEFDLVRVNETWKYILRFPIELLKLNVYGFSLLPSSIISKCFHKRQLKYLGLILYLVCFASLGRGYRQFARSLFVHSKQKRKFHGQQLQEVGALTFSLDKHQNKHHGYFLDIGAAYSSKYSNSVALQEMGWSGALVEPNPSFFAELVKFRATADVKVFNCAIGARQGTSKLINAGALSSLANNERVDIYDSLRKEISQKSVEPFFDISILTPNMLLKLSRSPSKINFLSIDTEGSEFEILRTFPFDQYRVDFVACEHNFEWDYLTKIDKFMKINGFKRVMRFWSAQDAWYINLQSQETSPF